MHILVYFIINILLNFIFKYKFKKLNSNSKFNLYLIKEK